MPWVKNLVIIITAMNTAAATAAAPITIFNRLTMMTATMLIVVVPLLHDHD